MNINTVTLIGRLTRDIELKYTQNGFAIGAVSIAVDSSRKNANGGYDEVANFFDVKILGKTAENLKPYLLKGKQIAVNGELQQERWTDQNTQQARSRVLILANNVQLIGGGQQQNGQQPAQQRGPYPQQYQPQPAAANDGFPEDIPF